MLGDEFGVMVIETIKKESGAAEQMITVNGVTRGLNLGRLAHHVRMLITGSPSYEYAWIRNLDIRGMN